MTVVLADGDLSLYHIRDTYLCSNEGNYVTTGHNQLETLTAYNTTQQYII